MGRSCGPAVRASRITGCCLLTAILAVPAGCSSSSAPQKAPASSPSAATFIMPAHSSQPDRSPTAAPRMTATPDQSSKVLADLAAGKVLVQAQCAACHALADAAIAGAAQPIAPALDHIGVHHSRAWLESELLNACAHPVHGYTDTQCRQAHSVAGLLTPQQRDQVVRYLLAQR